MRLVPVNTSFADSEPRSGDVWMVRISAGDGSFRIVPSVIIGISGNKVTFVRCRQNPDPRSEMYAVRDILSTGLSGTVFLEPNQQTCSRQNLVRKVGALSNKDKKNSKWR